MTASRSRFSRAVSNLVFVSLGVFTLGGAWLLGRIAPEWRWEHVPLHALVEGAGAFAALSVATLIMVLLRYGNLPVYYGWVATALVAMGILDGFHAGTYVGQEFVWLHSVSQFTGGVLFMGVMLPGTPSPEKQHRIVLLAAGLSTAFGIVSILFPDYVPVMQQDSKFTSLARLLNISGGIGFLVVAVFFVWTDSDDDGYRRLFAGHCLLFGLSGLIFEQSHLWDGAWWLWHGLRLVAYSFAFTLILCQLQKMQAMLLLARRGLEVAVTHQTEALQEEIVERERSETAYQDLALAQEQRAEELARLQLATLNIAEDAHADRLRADRAVVELQEVNAELDQFAYVASHDLKAPLRAIDKLAAWIHEDAEALLPEESKRHLATLRQRTVRMRSLLDDLLAYSRASRKKGRIETVNSHQVAHDVVEFIDPPVGIDIQIAHELPLLQTYLVPFELVLRNLISNGVKHMTRDTGTITVRAIEEGRFVAFTVADDGPGIPEIYRERIFEMFQTLAPKDEVEGTGMGLALVKKILDSEGGRIIVCDSELGGAQFTFWWPKVSHSERTGS